MADEAGDDFGGEGAGGAKGQVTTPAPNRDRGEGTKCQGGKQVDEKNRRRIGKTTTRNTEHRNERGRQRKGEGKTQQQYRENK